jgi:hypothetical protein
LPSVRGTQQTDKNARQSLCRARHSAKSRRQKNHRQRHLCRESLHGRSAKPLPRAEPALGKQKCTDGVWNGDGAFAEGQNRHSAKDGGLPSACRRHSAKFQNFAESPRADTRQRLPALPRAFLVTLGKGSSLYRVLSARHSAKMGFFFYTVCSFPFFTAYTAYTRNQISSMQYIHNQIHRSK